MPRLRIKALNFNEMDAQNKTSNPLALKNTNKTATISEGIGTAYPSEKKGQGNVEAEKQEVIVKADGKLFVIGGETHKSGGTDIKMEQSDFIFSNALKIKGDILKTEFGLNKEKEYSFSDVAKKYKKMNEYHKLADSQNPLEKVTADKMIDAYKDKLAKLAFLQESKKGFPNGIPQIAMPLIDKVSKVPQGNIPEGSMMKRGGELPEYRVGGPVTQNKKGYTGSKTPSFKDYYDTKKERQYSVPDEMKYFDPELFYTPEVLDYMKARDKEEGIDSDQGNAKDYTWGARHQDAYEKFFKGKVASSGMVDSPAAPPVDTTPTDFKPIALDETFKPQYSSYKDMGYSRSENLALANAMRPIPYFAPTRGENYGFSAAKGHLANQMPYNYQSSINEASRSGYNAFKANIGTTRNSGASMANNAFIAGKVMEQTSKIKGDEYNQNAQLYNNSMQQLSQIDIAQGQDREQMGQLYNNQVVQGRENLWANRMARNNRFVHEYSNAELNRSLRNAYGYLGQSTNPNYPFMDANMMVGWNPSINPFTNMSNGNNTRNSPLFNAAQYAEYKKSLPASTVAGLTEEQIMNFYYKDIARETTRNINTTKKE